MQIQVTLDRDELKAIRNVLKFLRAKRLLVAWRAVEQLHWASRGLRNGHSTKIGCSDFTAYINKGHIQIWPNCKPRSNNA